MQDKFISQFINMCIENGKSSPDEIVECAKLEIVKLDKKFSIDRKNLLFLIQSFGKDIKFSRDNINADIIINPKITWDKLHPIIKLLCNKICDFIEQNQETTIRDILDNVISIKANNAVYLTIQWLVNNKYLKRNNETIERTIIKGEEWANRPIAT